MQYLAVCYILFWVGTRFIKNEPLCLAAFGAIALASFFVFDNLQGEQALSFVGGVLAASLLDLKKTRVYFNERKRFVFVAFAGVLAVAIVLLAIKQLPIIRGQHHYVITLINLLMKSMFAAGVLGLTGLIAPCKRIVFLIGELSYSLYLVHGYFMFIVSTKSFGMYVLSCLGVIGVSFVAATIVHFGTQALQKYINKLMQSKRFS